GVQMPSNIFRDGVCGWISLFRLLSQTHAHDVFQITFDTSERSRLFSRLKRMPAAHELPLRAALSVDESRGIFADVQRPCDNHRETWVPWLAGICVIYILASLWPASLERDRRFGRAAQHG